MAYIEISAWEIAEAFGLQYKGTDWEDFERYSFSFHDKEIVHREYHASEEDAKEYVAERLLWEIGKHLSKVIGDI